MAATQSFTLTAVNDAPVLTGTKATLSVGTEDTSYTITQASLLAGFTDVDGDTLSVTGLSATNGTLSAFNTTTNSWTFTPSANFNGLVNLSYGVTDGTAAPVAATQTFTLAAVNDAPILTGTKTTLAAGTEDTVYTITQASLLAGFTDVDGNALSVTGLTATNGTLSAFNTTTNSWTFTPSANFNGTVNLSYGVSDGTAAPVAATQSFNLTAVNDAPVLTGTKATLAAGTEDTSYTITQASLLTGFTDVDGNALSVTGLTTTNGTLSAFNAATQSWTLTPSGNFNGTVNLSYNVTDGTAAPVAATQTFTLAAVNDAPILSGTKATLAAGTEDTGYTITQASLLAGFTDVDGDALSVTGLTATNGTLSAFNTTTNSWTFTPSANFNGTVNLSYGVSDGTAAPVAATQSFTLTAVNDAPVLTGTKATLSVGTEDTSYTITQASLLAGFTDVDGDTLSVTGLSATNGTLSAFNTTTNSWTFTPNANFNGVVNLSYGVSDGTAAPVAATQSFTLTAVNDAPVLTGTKATLSVGTEDTSYTITQASLLAGFTDVDGDTLSVTGLTATNGTLSAFNTTTNSWTFTPNANFNGVVNLSYGVSDGTAAPVAATQTFTLAAVNDAPTGGVTIGGTAKQNQTLTAANTLADADGLGALKYQWQSSTNGTTWTAISAATASTFTLGAAQVGAQVRVLVSYLDGQGTAESVTSSATAAVLSAINQVTGTAGADTLTGTTGADQMQGLAGNDTYVVNNAGDIVVEALNAGTDLVQSTISYTLTANVENLTLTGSTAINGTGNALNNVLTGNSAANVLDGGLGADTMAGGLGNDTYVVDNTGDVVTEGVSAGIDLVQSSVTYTLSANVNNITLTGTTAINATGNALDNILTGNSAANVLTGGAGNDTYVVGTGDTTMEAAGAGTDTVQSAITWTLAANVENLTLTGTAAVNGTGNTADNVLTGNSAANVLTGGAGNDTYVVGTGDTTIEAAGAGTDTVQSAIAWTLASNVENLTLTGKAAVNGTGNTAGNVLTGNSAVNTLTGGAGNDTLNGGAGADSLVGGTGNDTYWLGRGYGVDTITENDATVGNTDIARFDTGIATNQLWFTKTGNNLDVSIIGTTDKFTLNNWYLGNQYHVEQFKTSDGKTLLDSQVQNLVQAMASFAPPPVGQTTLTAAQQTALAPVIAANWQ